MEARKEIGVNFILVLTAHNLQKADCSDTGLRDKLESIISANPVVLVAEEVNADEDVWTFGRELIGEDKWVSIDMDARQRKEHRIFEALRYGGPEPDPETGAFCRVNRYCRHAEGIRENFWLDRIEEECRELQITKGTIVVTCGHNHGLFLAEKVRARGHSVSLDEYPHQDWQAINGKLVVCHDC